MKIPERMFAAFAASVVISAASAATPDEIALRRELARAYPGTQFTSVARTPIPGLYEIRMGHTVAFVSNRNVRYLVFGRLFDTQTMQDLTAPKLAQAASPDEADAQPIAFDRLPLGDAIRTVRGEGSRRLVVFSDPACLYCRQLEPELAKLDNVTIFTFVVPFQGHALPLGIVCARDRARAWREFMLEGSRSSFGDSANCDHPLGRNLALARELRVTGTPTLFFDDGSRSAGYAPAGQIESRLAAGSSKVRTASAREAP
jgi:thiol:disulfide interchange protein DsbC